MTPTKMSENMCVTIQCVSSSKNEWLSAQLDELIDLWEEQRILYDVTHSDYKNRRKKNRIVEEISAHLNRPGHEVKTKMKNLRSQFLAEIRKQRESAKNGAEVADLYTSKWKYFGRLAFILTNYPIAEIGHTSANFSHDLSDAEDETTFDATDDSSGPVVKHEVTRSKSKRNKRQKKEPDPIFEPEEISEKSIQSVDIMLPIREHERERERERDHEREDGCDVFGRHIANELRNLNVRHCQLAKLKIQQVLYELQTAEAMGVNQSFNHKTIETSPLSGMPQAVYKGSKNDADNDPLI